MINPGGLSFPDSNPYEDDGEGYGSRATRGSEQIVTTYGGWMTMLSVALIYGWVPEGGSYYCVGGSRVVSDADAAAIHLALDRYLAAPHEAYDRWLAYVARPKEQQAGIFPMGAEEHGQTTYGRPIDPTTAPAAQHWHSVAGSGPHCEFARRLSAFCARGAFRI